MPYELETYSFNLADITELFEVLFEKPVTDNYLTRVLRDCQKCGFLRFDAAKGLYNLRRNWACYLLQAKLDFTTRD